ncbi:MAG: thioredoxin domain-containing protein [Candidatus Peribacteria bacterium]|nr:MAG: thioredoxin domain-containing protein [Candidatus Peribacteria bacterium]
MLKDEGITTLPAAIFSRNGITGLDAYLNQLPSGNYSLALGSTFDPFAKRSERGFLVMEKAILDTIKSGAYVKGNTAAPITWLEYSDLECPYCARLHNSGTPKEIMEKYGESINMIFQHFPLDFHANAKPGAEVLECLAAQK